MFGGYGRAVEHCAVTFVSVAAQNDGLRSRLGLAKQTVAFKIHVTLESAI